MPVKRTHRKLNMFTTTEYADVVKEQKSNHVESTTFINKDTIKEITE